MDKTIAALRVSTLNWVTTVSIRLDRHATAVLLAAGNRLPAGLPSHPGIRAKALRHIVPALKSFDAPQSTKRSHFVP